MLPSLVIGFLLLPQYLSTVGRYDGPLKSLFYHTNACETQHGRELEDPDYYSSNSGVPHDPSSVGFMATHGTHRFLAVHEQTALLVGEGKHGVWRFQENGFIRVYRSKGADTGIPKDEKEAVLVDTKDKEVYNLDSRTVELLGILKKYYKNIDPKHEFDYAFGEEFSDEGWLNWIDLTIYHPQFGEKYDDHVPIDLPLFYCQMSSPDFPHIGQTWHIIKAQPTANKVGPLGKRAGVDIRENFNDVVRFHLFDDAGLWANIGQGNYTTDKMMRNLRDMKKINQTVSYQRVDQSKVDVEVYIMERAYHNAPETYLSMLLVMHDKTAETEQSYIRPDGQYYEGLKKRDHEIRNTVPDNGPKIPIKNETDPKEVFGLPTYGHHHMARIAHGLTGGGCPNKGGDVSMYPWGDAGSGFPTNYEEITPLCDGFVIDIKTWANMDKSWNNERMFLGNAGHPYINQTTVMYQAHANYYGKFTDPYNVKNNITNPHELDFTGMHKVQEDPGLGNESNVPVVDFFLDFGKFGEVNDFNYTWLDLRPKKCEAGDWDDGSEIKADKDIVMDVDDRRVTSEYMRYIRKELFPHTGACNTQHGRKHDDPLYYHSNSGMPHDPSSSGFMATHSTHRFLSMHEQTALLVGEGKHGVWRFQENGFIRVYRSKKAKKGVPKEDKEAVLVDSKDKETYGQNSRTVELLGILKKYYKNIDPKHEFDYAFGEEFSDEGWLNWIDLTIYHPQFDEKYDDHVPIDLPLYYCQMSSPDFPHMGATWHLMKVQPRANEVGPLGKRAGVDIRENFNDVVRFHQFHDAGLWANIGQGNSTTDRMMKNLDEMKAWNQTLNYKRVDYSKVELEMYVMERAYHNAPETYLSMLIVFSDNTSETEQSYVRPDGKYYEGLKMRDHEIKNTTPNNSPKIHIENEDEPKEVFGLPAYGHHHMARIAHGLTGGGCPTKGGDVSIYPWGDAGSGFPVNYEEITPLCDGFVIDIKAWVNLDKSWNEPALFVGNAGNPYANENATAVKYQAHANYYGKFTDPYNIRANITNPYLLDLTEDQQIQEDPGSDISNVPVVDFFLDFGKIGEVNAFQGVVLDLAPRTCMSDCISEIQAVFNHPTEKYAYVISGDHYVRLEADDDNMPVVSDGYPRDVDELWLGVEGEVEAAFTDYQNGRTFFFVTSEPRRRVYCWNWDTEEMEMDGEDEGSTDFAPLPQSEIKGMASYRDYVLFLFESEYYLWTAETGLHEEAQTWPYLTGGKSAHVSGAFETFLRGYYHTGNAGNQGPDNTPEKNVLVGVKSNNGTVERYEYRRFDEDGDYPMCF